MSDIKSEETQQELFPSFRSEARKQERFPEIQRSEKPILISTNIEQVILALIGLVLVCCLMFFMGMLREKAVSGVAKKSETARAQTVSRQPVASAEQQVLGKQPKTPDSARAQGARLPAEAVPGKEKFAAPQPPMPAPNPAKPYTIQLVTYRSRELAEKEVIALRRAGYAAMILPDNGLYPVCVGQYSGRDEAKKELKLFDAKYKGCYLRRR